MKELIIVDGYNYIFNIFDNIRLINNELEEIRDRFIDELAEYKIVAGCDVIVVFDSYKYPKSLKSRNVYKGIEVIFSGSKTTADHIIEELSNIKKGYEKKVIVTSDNLAQTVVFKENIYRKSSREFQAELQHIRKDLGNKIRKINKQRSSGSFSSIEKRLGKDQIEKMAKIVKNPDRKSLENKKDK